MITIFEGYGELKPVSEDENWKKTRLYSIYEKSGSILEAIQIRSKKVKDLDFSDYKPEIQDQKRKEFLSEPYSQLLTLIQDERERSQQAIKNLELRILNVSNPVRPKDIADRLSFDAKLAEIRQLIRNIKPEDRHAMITDPLKNGDPSFLWSCIDSPDQLIPKESLREIRRSYAFDEIPSLRDAENDAIELHETIKDRTSQISATAIKILSENDNDMPISRKEYFDFFPSENEFEQARQKRLIRKEEDQMTQREIHDNFVQENPGVSM